MTSKIKKNFDDVDLLTPELIAEHLQVCLRRVYELIQNGGLSYYRVGKSIRVQKSDYLQWLEDRKRQ